MIKPLPQFSKPSQQVAQYQIFASSIAAVVIYFLMTALSVASAATINVTAAPGEVGCELIEAINSANTDMAIGGCSAGNGADEIRILGTHTFTAPFVDANSPRSYGDAALPIITTPVTITGVDTSAVIRRDTSNPVVLFRLINVINGDLTLKNVTVRDGNVDLPGGGDNTDTRGGGIYIFGNNANLSIIDSKILDNRGGSFGGGLYSSSANLVIIKNSMIAGNVSNSDAAFNLSNVAQRIEIEDSTIEGNVTNSRTSGICRAFLSDLQIKRSAIVQNEGSAISVSMGSLNLTDSTISGNAFSATSDVIFADIPAVHMSPGKGSQLSMLNTTIVNNRPTADQIGSNLATFGVSIIPPNSTTTESLSVVARNNIISANSRSGANRGSEGAEVDVFDDGGNFLSSNVTSEFTANIIGEAGISTADAINNITISDMTNLILTSDSPDPTSLNSIVNPLGQYGGPTKSHTLPPLSPARDAGTDGFFTLLGSLFFYEPGCRGEFLSIGPVPPYRLDQRSLSRPIGDFCDIGSTEFRNQDILDTCFVTKAANDNVIVYCL